MNPNPAPLGSHFQQQPQQQQKGCLGRNWKWMLPVGCLGLIFAGIALVGGIVFVAMSAIKSSEVYRGALKVVQTHPAAVERLGEPIEDGWFVTGNIKVDAGGGHADFNFPVSGPKGSGTLYVRAVSPDGSWMYERLDLAAGGKTVSLLDRNVVQTPPGSTVDVEEDADDGASESEAGDGEAILDPETGVNVVGGMLDDKALSKPAPPYPPAARAARAAGTVRVLVMVDGSGKVTQAHAITGHPLLRPAAVEAAKQARFAPVLVDGKPTEVGGMLTYNFVLEQ